MQVVLLLAFGSWHYMHASCLVADFVVALHACKLSCC